MKREEIKNALQKLEQTRHCSDGYGADEILEVLGIEINGKNKKRIRGKLRSMISRQRCPEFATAGDEDIVYCPNGKGSGLYRLSEYR